jgi:UDP-N-acetylglucosamine diphosphorylase/glucosamine-1-phosphate N-acetyltransferase
VRLCIYEDSRVHALEPITLTRPAFALWCGAQLLFERNRRQFAADEIGFWTRPALAGVWRVQQPTSPINDSAWLAEGPTVWINGRWLPDPDTTIDPPSPHAGMVDDRLAYIVLPGGEAPDAPSPDDWLNERRLRLPCRDVGGVLLDFLWDIVEQNGDTLRQDAGWFRAARGSRPVPAMVAVEGPAVDCVIAPGATVEPFVFVDTRDGPVLIDDGAIVQSFSRLEGPCYVGCGTRIVGAKLRGSSTIGPTCRIGGEVEASVVQGYCNKYHDGFLGHSYLGEWVNIAAGTHTSDLRNDYEMVRVSVHGERHATGQTKVGSFIGDHTKTGLGVLLNTGSTIGAFANILPSGGLLPQVIPSFCQVRHGQLHDLWDLRLVLDTAGSMMQRRGKSMTEEHRDFYYHLFEATMDQRRRMIHEPEMPRLRRTV